MEFVIPFRGMYIEEYRLTEKIGEGGFGEVWKGTGEEAGDVVAVKIPTNTNYIMQLKKEGLVQFKLKHKNIIDVEKVNIDHNPPYMIMEYVDGSSLKEILGEGRTLSLEESTKLIASVLEALEYSHGEGVYHGDLKPGNILLDEDSNAKLMDFSLGSVGVNFSVSLRNSLESLSNREKESVIGTLRYMSPEQERGEEVDQRSDIYSLGLIFYEMLTGGSTRKLRFPIKGVPTPISDIIEKATEDRKENRYQTTKEMLGELMTAGIFRFKEKRDNNCPICERVIDYRVEKCPYCGINIIEGRNAKELSKKFGTKLKVEFDSRKIIDDELKEELKEKYGRNSVIEFKDDYCLDELKTGDVGKRSKKGKDNPVLCIVLGIIFYLIGVAIIGDIACFGIFFILFGIITFSAGLLVLYLNLLGIFRK